MTSINARLARWGLAFVMRRSGVQVTYAAPDFITFFDHLQAFANNSAQHNATNRGTNHDFHTPHTATRRNER